MKGFIRFISVLTGGRRCNAVCWRFRMKYAITVLFCVVLNVRILAQTVAPVEDIYVRANVMIPMRDGVKLYTEIYSPRQSDSPAAILFLRTPYGTSNPAGGYARHLGSTFRELVKDRYIIVIQDARGRHGSEGKFEWNRPVRHLTNPKETDDCTDAYDSIDWLIHNVERNNGRVGMLGVSYPGWYVAMALIAPHPALKAASPQASPSDYFIGDDFFHNGAFRLSPSAELPYLFDFDPRQNSSFPYDQVDTYEFFLDLGPLSNMNASYLHDVSPTWNNFMKHSTYDEFWKTGGTLQHFQQVSVPTLNVVGWWDAENLGGALDLYARQESLDDKNLNWLVVGPWAHGQWSQGPNDHLDRYEFGSDTVAHYQQSIEAPFFARYLRDDLVSDHVQQPEATLFQTGSNEWKTYARWPPLPKEQLTNLYLHAGYTLSFDPPDASQSGFATYISDPSKPVPFTARPVMGFWRGLSGSSDPRFGRSGKSWKVEDQRFVQHRPDVLSFVTEPLETDLPVAGSIEVRLFASTNGTDCDWVVKLIDVYPEQYKPKPEMGGYQLMIADEVVRAKFRDSFESPEALTPGEVNEFVIDLRTRNHMFRKGHSLMLQVQSSWFPLIDRNPQKFIDIPSATAADYQPAEQQIHFSAQHPSRVRLSVIKP